MNYDWKRLFVGTVPANFYHWWVKSLLTVAPSNSEPWNYEWKRLYVGTVPANFCHWPLTMELWLEEVICGYCPCKFLSLTMNYDWKRLFVGTVPAIFFIYHELWLEDDICGYCPCKFLSLTLELWLEEVICGYCPCIFVATFFIVTNFCWIFKKYLLKKILKYFFY